MSTEQIAYWYSEPLLMTPYVLYSCTIAGSFASSWPDTAVLDS